MAYHRRIFSLTYSSDQLPKFETDAEMQDYYAAVGRMVVYGLQRDAAAEASVQLVQAGITQKPLEVCCAYHQPLPEQAEKYEDGTPRYFESMAQSVDDFIKIMREKSPYRPFVMSAVKHSDNKKFGFHS